MGITKQSFGKSMDNQEVFLYSITNKNQMTITVTDFGATLVQILVPDKDGNKIDVALGYDTKMLRDIIKIRDISEQPLEETETVLKTQHFLSMEKSILLQ